MGLQIFFFKEAKKIWNLKTNFPKSEDKEWTLRIQLFKGLPQKFEGSDSYHL